MYCFVKIGKAKNRNTNKVYFLFNLSTPSSTGTWIPPMISWNLMVVVVVVVVVVAKRDG